MVLAVEDRLLRPLGLQDDIGYWWSESVFHRMAGGFSSGVPVPWYDQGWTSPAGQMFASANAMNALIAGAMGWLNNTALISPTTQREWMMQRYTNVDGATGMANPWEMRLSATTPAYWLREKDGLVPGYNAQLLVSPELQLSVACFTAAAPPSIADALANQIATPVVQAVDAWNRALDPVYPMPADPARFVGVYRSLLGDSVAFVNVSIEQTADGPVYRIQGDAVDGYVHVLDNYMSLKPMAVTGTLPPAPVDQQQATYFQTVPLRSQQGVYCPYMQGGYFYQTVKVATPANSSAYVLSIPGLYPGFKFTLTQK